MGQDKKNEDIRKKLITRTNNRKNKTQTNNQTGNYGHFLRIKPDRINNKDSLRIRKSSRELIILIKRKTKKKMKRPN